MQKDQVVVHSPSRKGKDMGKKSSLFEWSPKKMIFRILALEHQNAILRKKIIKENRRRLKAAIKNDLGPVADGPFDSDKKDFNVL